MATTKPAQKWRKFSVFDEVRVRDGGNITYFAPASDHADNGSDTEDENDEEINQLYLNKMSDNTDRMTETVFGEGVEVWRSHGRTVYANLTNKVKRKMREEAIWNEDTKK
jgi:hypothetical protein